MGETRKLAPNPRDLIIRYFVNPDTDEILEAEPVLQDMLLKRLTMQTRLPYSLLAIELANILKAEDPKLTKDGQGRIGLVSTNGEKGSGIT